MKDDPVVQIILSFGAVGAIPLIVNIVIKYWG